MVGKWSTLTCSSPEPVSELRIGVLNEPHSLDPHFHDERNTFSILGNIYEGLVSVDGDLMDMNERRDVLQEAMVMAMQDLPLIPLFAPRDFYGLRSGLDWTPRLDGRIFAYEVRRSQ